MKTPNCALGRFHCFLFFLLVPKNVFRSLANFRRFKLFQSSLLLVLESDFSWCYICSNRHERVTGIRTGNCDLKKNTYTSYIYTFESNISSGAEEGKLINYLVVL